VIKYDCHGKKKEGACGACDFVPHSRIQPSRGQPPTRLHVDEGMSVVVVPTHLILGFRVSAFSK